MKIYTGPEDYEIIESGSIIRFKDEDIKFSFDGDFNIIICFRVDSAKDTPNMSFEQSEDKKSLKVVLTNFDATVSTGNLEPLGLAKKENRRIYLNFYVSGIESSNKQIFHYTWYLREEIDNAK